jgi:hypothetical protein
MYNRYGPGLLDVIFALARGSGGRGGRIRLWSAIVLVLMATLAAIGGYLLLMGTPTTLAAAQIEDGYRPDLHRWTRRGRRVPNRYRISGHLANSEAVVFSQGGGTWRCAPLVSERGDADRRPRVYYTASEAQYRRARGENRFAGELYSPTGNFLGGVRSEAPACDVPSDALLLIDDGSLRGYRESGQSLLGIGGVVGAIALIAFVISLRKQDDEPVQPPSLPD